jgi:hypothetical protein
MAALEPLDPLSNYLVSLLAFYAYLIRFLNLLQRGVEWIHEECAPKQAKMSVLLSSSCVMVSAMLNGKSGGTILRNTIACKENRAKMSANECIVELVVRDGERNVDGNSGSVLLPNSVCMSWST